MIDYGEIQKNYFLCYRDKSRILFIEKYLHTFDATSGRKMPFNLFPRQKAFLKTVASTRNVVAIKHRQCGISTLSSAWVTAQCVFADKDAPETVLCIANKLQQAEELLIKIREFLSQVPRYYWGDDYFSVDPKSEKNMKSIFTKDSKDMIELFNGCRIIARASGPNAARGISAVSVLILDEAAFIEDGATVYATASATMASNPNSKTIMVSTPFGKDELYYTTYRQALAHENNFTAVEFRWYQDPRFNKNLRWFKKDKDTGEVSWDYDAVLDDVGTVKYDEERWAKLSHDGWTPRSPWYEEMCKSFNNDSMKIAQELDVSFLGSADNVVGGEYIEQQSVLNVREPLEDFVDPLSDSTWFWKKPIENHRYICACLPEGESVLTKRGMVRVETVTKDDELLTKEGEYTKIKHRKYREVEDEEIETIYTYSSRKGATFTWNHKIWASKDSYYDAKRKLYHEFKYFHANELEGGDYLVFPNLYASKTLTEDEMREEWDKCKGTDKKYGEMDFKLNTRPFWYEIGYWLGGGYSVNVGKQMPFNEITRDASEGKVHEAIFGINKNMFEKRRSIVGVESSSDKIVYGTTQLSCFMERNFGRYHYKKNIAEWIKFLPNELKLSLVEGYFETCKKERSDSFKPYSQDKNVMEAIQDILLSCGIVSLLMGKSGGLVSLKLTNEARNNMLYQLGKAYTKKRERRFDKFYLSEDGKMVFLQIREVVRKRYSGKVYNFETVSDSHSYCGKRIAVSNCDPSRGTSEDRTAIEIIDMDGEDENGMPIIEQVGEYVGKKLGDDIGALCYQYATLYNNAFVIIDATGGCGDAAILALINMGYKNLYYEDSNQKTYTIQNSTKNYNSYTDKLPGFHFQGNRYPVLANFAGLVRNNEFKIRSTRVINELDTWIFKGDTGRMDHQDGAHDDTICALAMGLFVMQYSLKKMMKTISKDKAILQSYMMSNMQKSAMPRKYGDGSTMEPKNGLPFYNSNKLTKYNDGIKGSYMWLFGKKK